MDWGALFSAFGLVFVAELGDKTQLAVVTQTCKHRRPWAVFLGASAALIAVTALGAIGGQVLGRLVPEGVLNIVAALAFVVMGVLVAREAIQAGKGPANGESCENPGDEQIDYRSASAWDWRAFTSTFGLLFVAERCAIKAQAGRAEWRLTAHFTPQGFRGSVRHDAAGGNDHHTIAGGLHLTQDVGGQDDRFLFADMPDEIPDFLFIAGSASDDELPPQ